MCPGVEVVPGKKTKKIFLNKANKFYKSISMNPIMVKKEITWLFGRQTARSFVERSFAYSQ